MNKVSVLAIPAALLASGCAPEEWAPDPATPTAATPDPLAWSGTPPPTSAPPAPPVGLPPSSAIHDWTTIPQTVPANLPSSSEVAARWVLSPLNPWAPYQKTTLLTTLDDIELPGVLPEITSLEVVSKAQRAASAVAAAGLPGRTMWIVDLRGPASVAFGATLSRESREPVSPVMTFNNWPADNESIPVEETLSALVRMQPRALPVRAPSTPVFMLDAWRLAYRYDQPDDETTDNRYMLMTSDFPDAATLRAQGIDQVLYVVESIDSAQVEEDDLHPMFLDYQAAGIATSIVDLADLVGEVERPRDRLYGRPLFVDSGRVIIACDPSFYHRARGGFGGTHVLYGGGHSYWQAYGFVAGHGGG